MTLHGHLGGFASYICEHGTLVGATLYVRSKAGREETLDRFCTVISADDPRTVRVGACVKVRYDNGYEETVKQDSKAVSCIVGSIEHREQLRQDFKHMDRNNDEVLSFGEMLQVFQTIAPRKWKKTDLQRIFDTVDTNNSGDVDLDEFIDWVTTGKKLPKRPKPTKIQGERTMTSQDGCTMTGSAGGINLTIEFPNKDESDAFVAKTAIEILENPEPFFEGGMIGGRAMLGTVSAMVIIANEPLSEKHLRAFRCARPALLAKLDRTDDFFKSPHAAEPKKDDDWPPHMKALTDAVYVALSQEVARLMGRLGIQ